MFGPLETYRWTERQNPGITNVLVMGPWAHGDWGRGDGDKLGDINFHAKTAEFYREKIELPFFRHFLKGDTNYTATEAHVFETGTDQWRRFDAWPPKQVGDAHALFPRGRQARLQAAREDADAFDEYVSDPGQAGALHDGSHHRLSRGRIRSTISVSPRRARTCWCMKPSRWRKTSRSPARSRRRCTSPPPAPMRIGWSS